MARQNAYTKTIFVLTLVVLTVCCISSVFGLGIAPAKTIVPNHEGTHIYSGLIINNEELTGTAQIVLDNSLGLISIQEQEITLIASSREIPFTYTITVPSSNQITGKIGTLSVALIADESGEQVSAQTTTLSPVYIGTESQLTSPNVYVEPQEPKEVKKTDIKEEKEPSQIIMKTKTGIKLGSEYVKNNQLANPRTLFTIISLVIIIAAALYIFWPYLKRDEFS